MSLMDIIQEGGSFQQDRRILVYLLLDISDSMRGAPLQAVQEGIAFLERELRNTPEAVQLAHLSVITFGSHAQVVVPLMPLAQFKVPVLACNGSTNMTEALELIAREIDRDFRPNLGGEVKGDFKPLLFLLTDGAPDNLSTAARAGQALLNRPAGKRIGTFLALGCGPHANAENLRQIAQQVALMTNMTADNIRQFFQWLSASIATASRQASRSAAGPDQGEQVAAPNIPKDAQGNDVFKLDF